MEATFDKAIIDAPTFSYEQLGGSLLGSAYNNDRETVTELVGHRRAPINFVDDQTGLTALHIAVGRDHLDIAKYLVERGASFLPDKQGRTPTTIAAECEVSDETVSVGLVQSPDQMAERPFRASRAKKFELPTHSARVRFSPEWSYCLDEIGEQKCRVQDTNPVEWMNKESISKIKNN
jgi:uncharacterized protein